MGYERNDRRFGGDDRTRGDYNRSYPAQGRDQYGAYGATYGATGSGRREWRGGSDRDRFDDDRGGRRDYGSDPRGYDFQDRGFFNRAGDEVRSWFGDDEAERRRQADERHWSQENGDRYAEGGRYAPYGSGYGGPVGGSLYGDIGGGYAPSDYGAGRGAGATGNWGLGAGRDHDGWGQDTGYRSWRDKQIADYDRDYDEYRREHQSKFHNEFQSWRQNRQGQRDQLGQVQEHFEVVGSDGQHVGTVDHVRGDHIKLTKTDKDAGGHHHSIPSSWIQSVDGQKVTISKTADQAKSHWKDEDRNSQGGDFFGRDRDRNLNRSFSGTY